MDNLTMINNSADYFILAMIVFITVVVLLAWVNNPPSYDE